MIELLKYFYLFIIAYILGSIPTSVWIGKFFYNIDVREHGSKSSGATNTIRVLGLKAGIPVLLIDAFKGWAAVNLTFIISNPDGNDNQLIYFRLILGLFAIIGHIFPVLAQFKGGKGVATLLGVFIAITPLATLLSLGVFIIVFISTRFVSVSSMSAGLLFPVFIYFIKYQNSTIQIIAIAVSALLIITHRNNIKRLIKGEENRFNFKKKSPVKS